MALYCVAIGSHAGARGEIAIAGRGLLSEARARCDGLISARVPGLRFDGPGAAAHRGRLVRQKLITAFHRRRLGRRHRLLHLGHRAPVLEADGGSVGV